MKNYSKRGRTLSYKKTEKYRYKESENAQSIYRRSKMDNMSLERLEIELKQLKKYHKNDKVSIQKCQNLIASKKKPQSQLSPVTVKNSSTKQ